MATPIIMPRQGQSVESCIIAKWHKKKGDHVNVGDVLFTYETDKATFEEESSVEGTLLEIFFEQDDDVPVLTNVCVIGQEGENTDEFNPHSKQQDISCSTEENTKHQEVAIQEMAHQTENVHIQSVITEEERVKISPRAKNLAQKARVDYRYANPTGPYGRIIEKDIHQLMEHGPILTPAAQEEYNALNIHERIAGTGLGGRITTKDLLQAAQQQVMTSGEKSVALEYPQYQDVKLSNIRKVIAKSMYQSLSTTAQLTLNTSFDATDILEYRKKLKDNQERLGLQNITLNDIILYAVSRTLLHHKELNAHFLEDKMRLFNNVNLGVAVDTDRGLMVPTIFNANLKSLNEISYEVKELVDECKKGTINPDYLQGGSFTITNLGTLDIESFTPVINPPQTGILGVNTIVRRVKVVNGENVYYPAMRLSLTFDHRALDGAPAAKFLKELKTNLESFSIMLAK